MISVIIPVYDNTQCELTRALRSVYQQQRNDLEIILVNDASPRDIDLSEFPGVIVLTHKQNQGVAAARNSGMVQASGDYFAFLDADDRWGPDKLNRQIGILEQAQADVIGVFNPFCYEDSPGHLFNPKLQIDDWFDYFLKGIRVGPGSTFVVHRKSFETIGPQDTNLKRMQDWDWLLRMARKYRFAHAETVYSFLGRASRPKKSNVLEESLEHLEEKWMSKLNASERRKFKAAIALERGAYALRLGEKGEALSQIMKAGLSSPDVILHNLKWKFL